MSNPVETLIELLKQWRIGVTKPRTMILPKLRFNEHPERNYSLKNSKTIKYLQHEHQTFGINLGWTDDATNATGEKVARWFFTRSTKDEGPIRYGEKIAIANGGDPSFVNFAHRDVGINLEYSDYPSFEWKLLGGKIGDPVYTHDLIAIFNEKSEGGECLVYFDRTVGGNIGWPSSKTWKDQVDLGDIPWKTISKEALKSLGAA
jgi:hypothetical protein